MCSLIPLRLEGLGLRAEASIAYQQSSYLCIEVAIADAEVRNVLGKMAKDPGALNFYEKLCDLFWWTSFEVWAEKQLAKMIGGKLVVQLPKTIEEKLKMKLAAEIEMICCTDEEQGPFLIHTINELNGTLK